MKKLLVILFLTYFNLFAQTHWFSLPTYIEISGYGIGFNIESFDLNNDDNLDLIVSNFNTTNVFLGGDSILDNQPDFSYKGRCLAICDFNGDGYNDMIGTLYSGYDSTLHDYTGNIIFYYGNGTDTISIDSTIDYSIPLPTIYPEGWEFGTGLIKFGTETGDFNNDGYDDILFAEPDYFNDELFEAGRILCYLGNTVPADTPSYSIEGIRDTTEGIHISQIGIYFDVGDINADGIQDILVSAAQKTPPPLPRDSLDLLYVFYGGNNFVFKLGNESIKYESRVIHQTNYSEWFRKNFSVDDINDDGIDDLVVGGIGLPDQTTNMHYGSVNGIDTIPSFKLTDPDPGDPTIFAGGISDGIGDFNGDGYKDFIVRPAGWKTFTLHFGGPYINNINRYGVRGLIDAMDVFPTKTIDLGDQNGDGLDDIAVLSRAGDENTKGYVLIILGKNIPVSVEDQGITSISSKYQLYQNYPNPFNPTTKIGYKLKERSYVKLMVYDIKGELVQVLINKEQNAGYYDVEFTGKYLSSGIYLYRIEVIGKGNLLDGKAGIPRFSDMRKMILVK